MGRPPSIEKHPLSLAMIVMRKELGMTQTQLAQSIHVTLPSIGKWESWMPPTGIALFRIAEFAELNGVHVATEFRRAVEAEAEDRAYAIALRRILKEPQFVHLRPRIRKLLAPALP